MTRWGNPLSVAASGIGYDPLIRTHPWGVVSYGGDSPDSLHESVDNGNSTLSNQTSRSKTASSKILDSVSSGGALPRDASSLQSAFIATNSPAHAAIQRKSPPFGNGEVCKQSLSTKLYIATDRFNEPDSINAITKGGDEQKSEKAVSIERSNGPLKILFLSSDTGGGHRASAEALANQVSLVDYNIFFI